LSPSHPQALGTSCIGFLAIMLIISSGFSPASSILDHKLHEAFAQPSTSLPAPTGKESSAPMGLLNQVNEYLPNISMVIGIVSPNGTEVYSYGNISRENSTHVNGDTIFDIGSITKTFTAALLVDMVKHGLINLDDPIEKYLPADVKVPTYNGHVITVEDLATHTSGLPDFPAGWVRNQSYTNQQVYNFLSNTSLQNEPGILANYSDFGMGLLGHILSLKSGIPYDKLVKDRILNVLGMDSTGIPMNGTGITYSDILESRLAKGHIGDKEVNLEFIPEALQPAGALYSTTNDLLKYLAANMGLIQTKMNDVLLDTHLIRYEYVQPPAVRATGELFSSNETLRASYVGLGWFIDTNLGTEIIQHSGSIDGYSSFMGFNPVKQIGLVQLCSCEGEDMPIQVREALAAFIISKLT
jgi:D-alanyl-D-alanine-carboxypeptidase/D-alanyl-D-alanine-endopeptidase